MQKSHDVNLNKIFNDSIEYRNRLVTYNNKLNPADIMTSRDMTEGLKNLLKKYRTNLKNINKIEASLEGNLFKMYYTHFNNRYRENLITDLSLVKLTSINDNMLLLINRIKINGVFMYIAEAIKEMYNSITTQREIQDANYAWTAFIKYYNHIEKKEYIKDKYYTFRDVENIKILRIMRNYIIHNALPSFLSYYVEALNYLKDFILNVITYAYTNEVLEYYYYILLNLFTAHKELEILILDIYEKSNYFDEYPKKSLKSKMQDFKSYEPSIDLNF